MTRGLEQVLVFISDGLVGLPDAVTDVFPHALHQTCWTHLQRHVLRHVRAKDKAEITQAAKRIYEAESAPEAQARLEGFCKAWQTRYPRVTALFEGKMNLFSFYHFPASIRRSLYTNNLAESLNKRLKRITKVKEHTQRGRTATNGLHILPGIQCQSGRAKTSRIHWCHL